MRKIIFLVMLLIAIFNNNLVYSQTIPLQFDEVTIAPQFVGGQAKLNSFVAANFITPEVEGVSGVIKVSFVVEIDGAITNIKIVQNLGDEFAQAAKNVFSKSPKWLPGELNGEKVRVLMNYPIKIQ